MAILLELFIAQVDMTAIEKQVAERKQMEEEEKLRNNIFGKHTNCFELHS